VNERRRIAFQGELGAFSEDAVYAAFGGDVVDAVPCRDFVAVADAVLQRVVHCGVLPVENSTAGSVAAAYDVLARAQLTIRAELVRPIRLCLLAVRGAALTSLRRVMSHPVALAQCARFLDTIDAERIAIYDTAGAARQVAQDADPTSAAVAGHGAALHYGLDVLAADIHDRSDNQTRFLIVSRPDTMPADLRLDDAAVYKTALLVETAHRAGALVEVLRRFADSGISLTHIESRPAEQPWHYRFVIEIEADLRHDAAQHAIHQARSAARSLLVLGSFPVLQDLPASATAVSDSMT
jgi:prephenate dehydratase